MDQEPHARRLGKPASSTRPSERPFSTRSRPKRSFMTNVIPPQGRSGEPRLATTRCDMPVRTQLPDLEHWKAQVKCQAGCPVATDAGRYVQLIAERRRRGGLPRRARARTRSPRCAAASARRPARTPAAAAPSTRRSRSARSSATSPSGTASSRCGPTRRTGCATRPIGEGNRYTRPPAGRSRSPAAASAAAAQGRRHRRGPRRPVRRARPRAARLRRHRLRSRGRAGRHDALRHPRVPPAAHADPRGDRQDPRARRDAQAAARRSRRRSASPSCARDGFEAVFLSVGVSRGRDLAGARASSSTASSRPSTTC